MANSYYVSFRNAVFNNTASDAGVPHALPDLIADTIRMVFLDAADHTTNLTNDQDFDNLTDAGLLPSSTRGSNPALATKTIGSVAAGAFDAADTTATSVSGDQFEEIVLYQDDGVADTSSPLIVNIDTATGLPLTPSGGDVTVAWAAGGILTA